MPKKRSFLKSFHKRTSLKSGIPEMCHLESRILEMGQLNSGILELSYLKLRIPEMSQLKSGNTFQGFLLLTISPSVAGPHPDSLFTVHSVLRAPKGVHHLRRGGEAGVPGSNIGEC